MTLYFYFLSKDGITMEQSEVEELEVNYSDNLYMLSSKLKNFPNAGIAVSDVGKVIEIDSWTDMVVLPGESIESIKNIFHMHFARKISECDYVIAMMNAQKKKAKERTKMTENFPS